ncbi:CPBP family intramembrane glutamic endopeptidase [Halonatronum saccharophilum]|uniref:CPBP family intramembrane glutamic endopeptidase n=1 Tax=Halonatronum saccharophilum TaxID=150060 RepID=UPI000489DF5F|nr:CPBP family intramembrane glutamic endopeptidase [Halonatronum saccharophilum]
MSEEVLDLPIENKKRFGFLKQIMKLQLIWYLINFLIIFFQSAISFELTFIDDFYKIIFKVIGRSFFISFLLYWSTMIYNLSFRELGINFTDFWTKAKIGIKLSAILFLGVLLLHLQLAHNNSNPLVEVINLENLSISLFYFLLLFIAYLIPAFSKELLYRGFIYYHFRKKFGVFIGFFISLIYYVGSYLNPNLEAIIIYTIVGIINTYLYERNNSILPSTIFQSAYYACLSLYLFSFSGWPF